MKYYSYQDILDYLYFQYHAGIMPNETHPEHYDIVTSTGKPIFKDVSLDRIRVMLTKLDFPSN